MAIKHVVLRGRASPIQFLMTRGLSIGAAVTSTAATIRNWITLVCLP
ncbi:hypothetical protein BH10PLA2_BH10PLA2_00800 [soil metagenome]